MEQKKMSARQNRGLRIDRPQRAGTLLVASPHAAGTPSARSVVLLLEERQQGVLGVLLDETFRASIGELEQRLAGLGLRGGPAEFAVRMRLNLKVWEPGQLDREFASGLWLTAPRSSQPISYGDDLWAELVRAVGRSVLRDTLRIEPRHIDPSLN
jgi:putative AlgH/UPF0301 family transcriptional regulator